MKKQSGWTKINRLYMVLFIWVFVSPAMANYQSQEGRWMQQDPMGVNPTGGKLNPYVPPKQYKDGLNIYEYCKSNPIQYNDVYGTDIYVMAGPFNWRNAIISLMHEKICVDVWKYDTLPDGTRVPYKEDVLCVSFGIIKEYGKGLQRYRSKNHWIKWDIKVPEDCYRVGVVYVDSGGTTDYRRKSASIEEEMKFEKELRSLIGKEDIYSPLYYNCIYFTELLFNEAPGPAPVNPNDYDPYPYPYP